MDAEPRQITAFLQYGAGRFEVRVIREASTTYVRIGEHLPGGQAVEIARFLSVAEGPRPGWTHPATFGEAMNEAMERIEAHALARVLGDAAQ